MPFGGSALVRVSLLFGANGESERRHCRFFLLCFSLNIPKYLHKFSTLFGKVLSIAYICGVKHRL